MNALNRSFGFWTGWFLVVACMVGSGILTTSGPIVRATGSYGVLLSLWALGGVIALCGALSLGELASGWPRVGGDYAFVRAAYGPRIGFVYGWSTVVLGFAAPNALIAYTTAIYLQPAVETIAAGSALEGFVATQLFLSVVSSFLLVLFTGLHCLGQTESSRVQGATTVFKLGVLIVLVLVALFSPVSQWSNLVTTAPGAISFGSLASSLVLVMYAYTGWNAAAYLAGEIREASRVVPWCLTIGCLAVTALYLVVNMAYGLALSPERMMALSEVEVNRIADSAARVFFGDGGARIVSLLISLGVVASLSAYTLTGPRVVFAMARDGLLPLWVGHVDERSGTPVRATIFQGLLSLLLLWSGSFQELLDFTGYGLGVLATLVVAPIFTMRKHPEFRPTFRVPLYPWVPLTFLGLCAAMLIGSAIDNPKLAALSTLSIALGFPIYAIWKRKVAAA